jgi:hypothetical protein
MTRKKPERYFQSPLQQILESELGRGNRIRSASDWPPRCVMLVLLDRPFKRRHRLAPGMDFKKLDDPHYWQAEYSVEIEPGKWECLACDF